MFYEETLINGALHYRLSPHGSWILMNSGMLQEKYLRIKEQLRVVELALEEASRLLKEASHQS